MKFVQHKLGLQEVNPFTKPSRRFRYHRMSKTKGKLADSCYQKHLLLSKSSGLALEDVLLELLIEPL